MAGQSARKSLLVQFRDTVKSASSCSAQLLVQVVTRTSCTPRRFLHEVLRKPNLVYSSTHASTMRSITVTSAIQRRILAICSAPPSTGDALQYRPSNPYWPSPVPYRTIARRHPCSCARQQITQRDVQAFRHNAFQANAEHAHTGQKAVASCAPQRSSSCHSLLCFSGFRETNQSPRDLHLAVFSRFPSTSHRRRNHGAKLGKERLQQCNNW
jgi:hypothetical protein